MTDSWNLKTNHLQKGLFVALAGGFFDTTILFPALRDKGISSTAEKINPPKTTKINKPCPTNVAIGEM